MGAAPQSAFGSCTPSWAIVKVALCLVTGNHVTLSGPDVRTLSTSEWLALAPASPLLVVAPRSSVQPGAPPPLSNAVNSVRVPGKRNPSDAYCHRNTSINPTSIS